jgi:hypothetical protein
MILSGDESFLESINIQSDIENSFDNSFKVYSPVLNDFRAIYQHLIPFVEY